MTSLNFDDFFLYKKSKGVGNGDTMTKNNNQSLKIKDGHKVPEKGTILAGMQCPGTKNTWDVKYINQF